MKRIFLASAMLFLCAPVFAQTPEAAKPVKAAYYIDPKVIDLPLIVPMPPAQDSAQTKAELVELHRIEQARTPAQAAAAQADDQEEDIFVFRAVLGEKFRSEDLPLTTALSTHLHKDESAVSDSLKGYFQRPRPYQFDTTLHPVCKLSDQPNSYPSGHTLTGYLEALTLAQIVPEKRQEILARADDYAHNREVCGVHYASDLAASHNIAYAVFGYMMATPRFQIDLAAARAETRKKLGLN